jgi:hypothetical protein
MNSYVNQLVDDQHEAIDTFAAVVDELDPGYAADAAVFWSEFSNAMQPEMIRQHETRGIVDVGTDGCYKVWYAVNRSATTRKADTYSEAIRLMERALADGAGVVTIERAYGFVWTQEVWALVQQVVQS